MPASFQEMADAYILAAVFAYSAAHATNFSTAVVLAVLASIVLLINSHYLHAPIHPRSTLLALMVLLIPFFNSHAAKATKAFATALERSPQFILEAIIGFLLLGFFVRFAIFRPLAEARKSRRSINPIPVTPAPQHHPKSPTPAALPQPPAVSEQTHPHQTLPVEHHLPRSPTPSTTSAATHDTSGPAVQQHIAAVAAAARTRLESPAVPAQTAQHPTVTTQRSTNVRRRRPPTKSQLLAARILAERQAEEAQRMAAMEARQAELKARSDAAKAERLEREKLRRELQEQVREAARGVTSAKEALAKAMVEADKARMERRRAADQAVLVQSEENERALDEVCKEAARLEMAEQMALNEVNAAQARWTDLQNRLNVFDRS